MWHPKLLPRPVGSSQDHLGAAAQLSALGSTKTRSAKRTGYLFVNKSQASECLSNCKTNSTQSTINTHVQRFRLSAQSRVHNSGEYTSPPRGEERTLHRHFAQRESGGVADDGHASNDETGSLDPPTFRTNEIGGGIDTVFPLYSNNFLEGDAFNPFGGTTVPIDKSTHTVLQFFLHLGWKAHLRNIGRVDQLHWSKSFDEVSSIVRGCLSNQMHMYAFLACIPMRMNLYGVPSTVISESPEASMSKALRTMRMYFAQVSAGPFDHQVILDIFFVSLAEFFRKNFAAMRIHLRMVHHIVDSLGGWDRVSQYIREVCCYTELCFALRTGEMPLFEMMWDPGPAQCNEALQDKSASWPLEIKACGTGFENPLCEGFFDGTTKSIIEELANDIPALEYVRNDAEAAPADSQWACIRSRAMLHRLLSLRKPNQQGSLQERKAHCVITALIMLMGYENLCVSPLRYSKPVRRRLIDALKFSNSDFNEQNNWGRHNDMLLWITITGVRIARGSDDEEWFMSRAVQGCRILGLESYDQLHGLVRKFIWVENQRCPALTKLTGQILIAKAGTLDTERRHASLADPDNLGDYMFMLR